MGLLSPRARTALVVALGAQRILELRRSTRNRAGADPAPRAAASTYPAMVAVHAALFGLCLRRRNGPRTSKLIETGALAGLVVATALRISAIRALGESWNVTGHVDPATRVVTTGPYRWLRHPNYAAVALEFVCLPLAVGAVPEAILFSVANVAVLVPRIRAEERLLDQLPGYKEAFADVPRFVPRPGRTSVQSPSSASHSRARTSRSPM